MQRLTVLTGNFGSGKTEIALALAQRCAAQGERVKLVDLDVVNPYFTASGHREAMERQGIEIIAPAFAGTGVDVPALTGSVRAAFVDQQARLLFDLGGDPVGATVVSSLLPLIQRAGGADVWFVCNAYRPFTSEVDGALSMMQQLSDKARLPITGILNNANLAAETTAEHLLHGDALVRALQQACGLPVLYHCGTPQVLAQAAATGHALLGEPLPLAPCNHPDWL